MLALEGRRKRYRSAGRVALHAATAVIALKVGVRLFRATAHAVLGGGGSSAKRLPSESLRRQLLDSDHALGDHATAREQWQPSLDPPPAPPADAKLVASAELPMTVYHFYERFLSVQTTCLQDHHVASGQTDFHATRWRPDGSGGLTRTFMFTQPKKGIASMPARCTQRHRLGVHPGDVLSLTTDMQPADIPYADAFRVQSYWVARPDERRRGCRVEIRVAVPFSRPCMLKGVITKASVADCREFFSAFLDKVARAAAEGTQAGAPAVVEAEPRAATSLRPAGPTCGTAKARFAQPGSAAPVHPSARRPQPFAGLQAPLLAAVLLLQAVMLWQLLALRWRLEGSDAAQLLRGELERWRAGLGLARGAAGAQLWRLASAASSLAGSVVSGHSEAAS